MPSIRLRKWAAGFGAAAMLLGLAGCGGGSGSSLQVIKIATQSPLSGPESVQGIGIKNGAQMKIDEEHAAFAKEGFDIQLDAQDDKGDPKTGVANAQKLATDPDVLAVDGHLDSGVIIPSEKSYHDGHLAVVSPANTNPNVTSQYKYDDINRICGRDDVQGPVGAVFANKELGAKNVFVIDNITAYGTGVAQAFIKKAQDLGMNVVGTESIAATETDYSNVLNKIQQANPDLVYYGGLYQGFGLLLNQAKSKGISVKWMGPDGTFSKGTVQLAKDNAIGVYATSVAAPTDLTDAGKQFIKDYQTKYNDTPDPYAIYGYDAMGVILQGLQNAIDQNGGKKPTREQVVTAIRAISDYQGALVKVGFDSIGDNKYAGYFVYQFTSANPDTNGDAKLMAQYDPSGNKVGQ